MIRRVLLIAAVALLASCGTISGGSTPQNDLNAAEAGFAVLVTAYDATCVAFHPPACTDPKAVKAYNDAKAAVEAAFQTAQDAINAGQLGPTQITQLVTDAINAVAAFAQVVSDIQNKASLQGAHIWHAPVDNKGMPLSR